jgi:NADH-quinone oxidoreductase subunit E
MIKKETEEKIINLKGKYPKVKTAILPAFHILYKDVGYLKDEGMHKISELLGIPILEIYEVASFYTFFPREKIGKYWIRVCDNLSCSLLGAEELIKYLEEKLKIKVNQTTPDGLFTLSTVECLGSCGTAPVMMINEDYHENLTKEKIDKLLEGFSSPTGPNSEE